MFLQADLGLSFQRLGTTVRVPPPSPVGKLLHWLTLGTTGEPWEREAFVPEAMIRSLATALADAGLTDLVSAACDDAVVYLDQRRRDDDLAPVLDRIAKEAGTGDGDTPTVLELVAQTRDEVGDYVIQLTAERLHPVDRCPIRIRIYALLRAFALGGETGRSEARRGEARRDRAHGVGRREALMATMRQTIRSPDGFEPLVAALDTRLLALCERIEGSVRAHLQTHETQALRLCCAVRSRETRQPDAVRPPISAEVIPVLRGYPGLVDAAFYLQCWLSVLTELGAEIRKTLIVDEAGHPVLHIGDEAAKLGTTRAYVPQGSITDAPGALDVVYFGGSDYEDELRRGGRISESEVLLAGEPAWKLIRERELGVKAKYRGLIAMQAASVGSLIGLGTQSDGNTSVGYGGEFSDF